MVLFLAQRAALDGHPKRKKKQASKHLTYKIINISWTDRYLLDTMLKKEGLVERQVLFFGPTKISLATRMGLQKKEETSKQPLAFGSLQLQKTYCFFPSSR